VGTNYSLQINQPGSQIFSAAGGDVFQSVADLVTALQTNSNIGNAVAAVRGAFDHVTSQRVFYGNAVNQLNAQQNYLNSEKADLATAANSISGADIAETAATLNQAEVALNAELAAMGKISQNNLFDYLK
jgi:flagellin-like hook-associated protein FlgL